MAERMKADYGLSALRVSLDTMGPQVQVVCSLEIAGEDGARTVERWTRDADSFGLPVKLRPERARDADYAFALPEGMIADLVWWVREHLDPERPLWLHLAEPYGYLGLVPWERLLQPQLGTPVLRLPPTVKPRKPGTSLEVVLCAAAPEPDQHPTLRWLADVLDGRAPAGRDEQDGAGERDRSAEAVSGAAPTLPGRARRFLDTVVAGARLVSMAASLTHLVEAVLRGSPRTPTRIHVFTTPPLRRQLEMQWASRAWLGEAVLLYEDPAAAPPDGTDDPHASGNPWLQAVLDQVHERIDVVHFVCHGGMALNRGLLSLAPAGAARGAERAPHYVTAVELLAFLNRVGAWSAAFTSAPGNPSELGLRSFADALGRMRPGPVLYHGLAADPSCEDVAAAYRCLYAVPPTTAPVTTASFLYCEPFRVERRQEGIPGMFNRLVTSTLVDRADAPRWVATAQRYIDQTELELRRWSASSSDPAMSDQDRMKRAGVEEALQLIRKVVVRHQGAGVDAEEEAAPS